MLDSNVDKEWIEHYISQGLHQLPEEAVDHFDEYYGKDRSPDFYRGMWRQALNDFNLIQKIVKTSPDISDPVNIALRTAGQNIIYHLIYLSSIIKELTMVN